MYITRALASHLPEGEAAHGITGHRRTHKPPPAPEEPGAVLLRRSLLAGAISLTLFVSPRTKRTLKALESQFRRLSKLTIRVAQKPPQRGQSSAQDVARLLLSDRRPVPPIRPGRYGPVPTRVRRGRLGAGRSHTPNRRPWPGIVATRGHSLSSRTPQGMKRLFPKEGNWKARQALHPLGRWPKRTGVRHWQCLRPAVARGARFTPRGATGLPANRTWHAMGDQRIRDRN